MALVGKVQRHRLIAIGVAPCCIAAAQDRRR